MGVLGGDEPLVNEGEFSIINGKPTPVGPWLPLGPTVLEVYETQVSRGFMHRAGNGTYGPTWLAVLRAYPDLRKWLTDHIEN